MFYSEFTDTNYVETAYMSLCIYKVDYIQNHSVVQLYWLIEGASSRRLGGRRYRQWSLIVCRISTGSSNPFHSQVCLIVRCMDDIWISVDNQVIPYNDSQ